MKQTTEKPTADPVEDPSTVLSSSALSVPSVSIASKADLERLSVENARLRSELQLRSARDTLVSALVGEQARSPELLFDASVGRFAFDDDGVLVNTDDLVSELRQKFPEQFGTEEPTSSLVPMPTIHAGAGRIDRRLTITREALAKMSPQDIARLDWNDVKQVLQQQ